MAAKLKNTIQRRPEDWFPPVRAPGSASTEDLSSKQDAAPNLDYISALNLIGSSGFFIAVNVTENGFVLEPGGTGGGSTLELDGGDEAGSSGAIAIDGGGA